MQAANELFSHGAPFCVFLIIYIHTQHHVTIVKSTREAALDARLLLHTTRLASERVHQLKLDTSSFDKEEFMRRLRDGLIHGTVPTRNESSSSTAVVSTATVEQKIHWSVFKSAVTRALIRAPSIGFMYVFLLSIGKYFYVGQKNRLGPLALEPKIRKEPRKAVRLKKDLNDLKKPKEVICHAVPYNISH